MVDPRRLFSAIGATKESARAQIDALGPATSGVTPSIGDSLIWNGTAWVPGATTRFFVFQQGATQVGNVFGDWAEMFDVISALPFGEQPYVSFVNMGGPPITIPSAGMPAAGWDMRGGTWGSFYRATGSVIVDIPDGVMIDNWFGYSDGLVVKINPSPGTSVTNFSAIPLGGARIFQIGQGTALDHSTNTGAFIRSPGGAMSTTMVLALFGTQTVLAVPPLSGPIVEMVGDDGLVCAQIDCFGGVPPGWAVGGGPTTTLLSISDVTGLSPFDPTYAPGLTIGGGITALNFSKSSMLPYVPSVLANWSGVDPGNVAAALDRIAAMIGPVP